MPLDENDISVLFENVFERNECGECQHLSTWFESHPWGSTFAHEPFGTCNLYENEPGDVWLLQCPLMRKGAEPINGKAVLSE